MHTPILHAQDREIPVPLFSVVNVVAEMQGFEPWIRVLAHIHDFQSCSFNQLGHISTGWRAMLWRLVFLSIKINA